MSPLISNPLLLIFAQTSILALSVGLTNPRSPIRFGLFPVTIFLCWKAIISLRTGWTNNFAIATCLGCVSAREVLQYLVVALVQPWDFTKQGPSISANKTRNKISIRKDTILSRLFFGYEASYSNRHCGTTFEVAHVPPFSRKNPTYTPEKWSWILITSVHCLVAYLILDLTALANDPAQKAIILGPDKIPFSSRMWDVTTQEVVERLVTVASIWILGIPVIYLLMRVPAVVFVTLGLQRVEQFKPLFNFGEGLPWSVRRFWSHFWHQMLKDKLYLPSKYIVDNVLHIPLGSISRRYTLIILSFTLSGFAHIAGEYASGMDMRSESGAMQFFVQQAMGMMIEDFVVFLWKRIFGEAEDKKWHFRVGQVWFVIWMFWSTPIWGYPAARGGDGKVVPWSVVEFCMRNMGR